MKTALLTGSSTVTLAHLLCDVYVCSSQPVLVGLWAAVAAAATVAVVAVDHRGCSLGRHLCCHLGGPPTLHMGLNPFYQLL